MLAKQHERSCHLDLPPCPVPVSLGSHVHQKADPRPSSLFSTGLGQKVQPIFRVGSHGKEKGKFSSSQLAASSRVVADHNPIFSNEGQVKFGSGV